MKKQDNATVVNSPVTTDLYIDAPIAPSQPEVRERTRPVFTGLEDHSIAIDEASELTRNYRMSAGKGAI
ncbi:MAG: hypothetical protein KFH87_02995, partial [Bacteroidetes bacterium]|nr:hypothetical protein [Bacteroidota bacterium]